MIHTWTVPKAHSSVKFYSSVDNFTQALLVTNITSALDIIWYLVSLFLFDILVSFLFVLPWYLGFLSFCAPLISFDVWFPLFFGRNVCGDKYWEGEQFPLSFGIDNNGPNVCFNKNSRQICLLTKSKWLFEQIKDATLSKNSSPNGLNVYFDN